MSNFKTTRAWLFCKTYHWKISLTGNNYFKYLLEHHKTKYKVVHSIHKVNLFTGYFIVFIHIYNIILAVYNLNAFAFNSIYEKDTIRNKQTAQQEIRLTPPRWVKSGTSCIIVTLLSSMNTNISQVPLKFTLLCVLTRVLYSTSLHAIGQLQSFGLGDITLF